MFSKSYSLLFFAFSIILLLKINAQDVPNGSTIQLTQSVLGQTLDPIKTTVYKEMYHKCINVSIGEQLSIVLPSFDSVYNPETIEFKYLSQQQYATTLNKLQNLNAENQNTNFQNQQTAGKDANQQIKIGNPVSQSQLPLKCSYVPPSAQVYEVISKIGDQTGYNHGNLLNKIYVLASSRQLLYILNTQNMILSAYYYNDINIKFLSSFQLPTNKDPHELQPSSQSYTQSHSSISMTLNSKQTELYIFSIHGIWVIQTKTFLTNIKQVSSISGFEVSDIGGLDKVIRGGGSYFVGMKKMNKVFIIPQASTNERAVYTEVTAFNEEHIFPQDIAIHSSYLFVLDVYKGVYIYRISGDGKARELFKIGLENYGGNYRIHLFQMSTLFVNFNDFDGSKVVEINIDLQNKKAELVRYFKNDDYISFLQTYNVLTSSTGFYLNQISVSDEVDIKHIRNSAETLLFMVSNFQQIQIFPFNIDPRTINQFYNGVKINYPKVKEVYHIFEDRFLVITEDTIDYVKISIEKPEVSCLLGSKYNQNYKIQPENLQITIKSNVSTCEFRNKLLRHKNVYNQNCELVTQYLVRLNDPEKSNLRKVITYGIVLLVVAAFILGLFCLVQWRKEKLVVLSRLKDEILRFRNRHRRMQPFVEEQIPQMKQVQMEVPKDIQYIPNQDQN